MTKRLSDNTNIHLITGNEYNGLPILSKFTMSANYLDRLVATMQKAIDEYRRTYAIRFDLTVPLWMGELDTALISRFFASLNAQIQADLKHRARDGKRVFPCTLRYSWAKEQHTSHHWHYHCVIYLNRDSYGWLGDIGASQGNMAARIKRAWASALGVDVESVSGLVHFCGEFVLDGDDPWFQVNAGPFFEAISYLAKVVTKHYGDGTKNFSCSNY